jgi:exosortase
MLIVPVVAMLAGLLLHSAGFVAEQARLSILGLLLFSWGVVAFAGGERWERAAMFPLAFMVFAIPLNALDSIGFWLRMSVVSVSAKIAHGMAIEVLVNGTQLLSPDGKYDYDVAAACSGVRSLVALSALSLLIGYLRFRPIWLRVFMFALSIPLVFVGNVVRIVAIIAAAQFGGQALGDHVHEIMGFFVFAIVLGGVFAAAEITARLKPVWSLEVAARSVPPQVNAGAAPILGVCGVSSLWTAAIMVVLFAGSTAAFLEHVFERPARGLVGVALAPDGFSPVELPTFIGTEWIGRRSEVTAIEREVLPRDTGYSRKIYVSIADPSKQTFLSIVLSGRDRTSIHRPELCLVGQGWTINGSFSHQFSASTASKEFPATVLRVAKEVSTPNGRVVIPQLVAYYFVGGDAIVATNWERVTQDAWNRVVHGRADRWAYVLIQTSALDGEQMALQRIQKILDGTLPVFQRAG